MKVLKLSAILLLTGIMSVVSAQTQNNEHGAEEIRENAKFAAEAQTEFGFDLFRQVLSEKSATEKATQNILTSPTSAALALSMTMAGANDGTLMQMLTTLRYQKGRERPNPAGAQASVGALMQSLQKPVEGKDLKQGTVQQLSIANRVWYNEDKFKVDPHFSVLMNELYSQDKSEGFLVGAQFVPEKLVAEINKWVESKTADNSIDLKEGQDPRGMIKDLLKTDDIKPNAVMVLVNALYFQGQWLNEMQETPEKIPFQTAAKKKTLVNAVKGSFSTHYLNNHLLGVQIPFRTASIERKWGDVAAGTSPVVLEIFQEKSGAPIAGLMASMNASEYSEMWEEASVGKVNLTLPKFNFTYKQSLKETLKAIGMKDAFDAELADFSKLGEAISGENVFIGDVIQKTAIELDEKGLKAAAATAVIMAERSVVRIKEPVEILFDKPFALVLRDTATNTVMFTGIVNDPSLKQ